MRTRKTLAECTANSLQAPWTEIIGVVLLREVGREMQLEESVHNSSLTVLLHFGLAH